MAVKLGFASPNNIPKRAICDPELTLGLPKGLTAATGMDAVAHCVETFISPVINPPAEGIAFEGLRRAIGFIERAVADGNDREARWEMMMAAMLGAMSFQKGLGAVHAISHPLGGMQEPRLHHGTLNAVVMPAVLRSMPAMLVISTAVSRMQWDSMQVSTFRISLRTSTRNSVFRRICAIWAYRMRLFRPCPLQLNSITAMPPILARQQKTIMKRL